MLIITQPMWLNAMSLYSQVLIVDKRGYWYQKASNGSLKWAFDVKGCYRGSWCAIAISFSKHLVIPHKNWMPCTGTGQKPANNDEK